MVSANEARSCNGPVVHVPSSNDMNTEATLTHDGSPSHDGIPASIFSPCRTSCAEDPFAAFDPTAEFEQFKEARIREIFNNCKTHIEEIATKMRQEV